jgi:hypothetical protein
VLRRPPKEEERSLSLLSSPQCRRRRSSNSYDNNKRPEARLPSSTCTCAPPIRTFAPMTPMVLHVLTIIPLVRRVCRLRDGWVAVTISPRVCKTRHTDVIDDVSKERSGNASIPRHPYIRQFHCDTRDTSLNSEDTVQFVFGYHSPRPRDATIFPRNDKDEKIVSVDPSTRTSSDRSLSWK